jgi:hypothetical protein
MSEINLVLSLVKERLKFARSTELLTGTCPVPPKRDRRGPCQPVGPEPSVVQGRQEGAPYERNFLCWHPARHCVPGKPRSVGGELHNVIFSFGGLILR